MREYKAEAFIVLLISLIGISGYLSWQVYSWLLGVDTPGVESARGFALYASILTVLASVCSALVIYPLLRRSINETGQMQQMTSHLTERSKSLEEAAVTDVLTGMSNRRYFDDALAEYMRAFSKIDRPLGMIVLDLDHFKAVNDTHGHDVGDDVLRAVAERLNMLTRQRLNSIWNR